MWGSYSSYNTFPSQYTAAIHQPWLHPCPASSLLQYLTLLPLSISPHSSAQPALVHPLCLATEIPFPTTEHPLLSCSLMSLSIHLSVLFPVKKFVL